MIDDEDEHEEEDLPDDDGAEHDDGIQVDIDESTSNGIYSNLVISNFSQEEFVLDFVFLQPQLPKGKIRSRIILSPNNVKRLATLLKNNIKEYEDKFGAISDDPGQPGIRFSNN